MRRYWPTLFLLLSLVVFIPPAAAHDPGHYHPIGVKKEYLALGDSLAWGFGADYLNGYVRRFWTQDLKPLGSVELKNIAIPGETTTSFIGDYFQHRRTSNSQLAQAVREIKKNGANISPITIDIGGNDLLDVPTNATLEEQNKALATIRRNLNLIIATIRGTPGFHADFPIMDYYDPMGQQNTNLYGFSLFTSMLKGVAAKYRMPVADVYERFVGHECTWTWYCKYQDIHPNNLGYQQIADEFWRVARYSAKAPSVELQTVDGHVTANGAPMANATVYYGGGYRTTDSQGRFRFRDVSATGGAPYLFGAGAPHYELTATQPVTPSVHSTQVLTFSLVASTGSVTGFALDSANTPIAGAVISYTNGQATSGADGSFTLSAMTSDRYTLTCAYQGHAVTQDVGVSQGAVTSVTFRLP